jgi:hypothetical protein
MCCTKGKANINSLEFISLNFNVFLTKVKVYADWCAIKLKYTLIGVLLS